MANSTDKMRVDGEFANYLRRKAKEYNLSIIEASRRCFFNEGVTNRIIKSYEGIGKTTRKLLTKK